MFTSLEKKILTVLAFVQFNHIVDFMIIMPMGTQLMRLFDIQAQQFSLLVSSYTFFAGLSGFLASFYMDLFDRKKSLMWLFAGFTLATVFCGVARDYHTLLIARAMTGFFGGVMNSIILSITSDLIDYKRRGMAMGFLATAFSVASIVGVPFSIFLSQSLVWYAPFIFLASLCLIILLGIYKYVPSINKHLLEDHPKPSPTANFWQPMFSVLQSPVQRMSLIFMFFVMFSHFSIIPFIATSQVVNAGLSEQQLTLIYLIGGICSFFSAPFVGRLSDRYGKAKIYMYSILFSILPIFLVTHQQKDSLWVVVLVAGLFLNIPRMNEKFDYQVTDTAMLPSFMQTVCDMSGLSELELHKTFNMGVGFVIATDKPEAVMQALHELGEKSFVLGKVKPGSGKVYLKGEEII